MTPRRAADLPSTVVHRLDDEPLPLLPAHNGAMTGKAADAGALRVDLCLHRPLAAAETPAKLQRKTAKRPRRARRALQPLVAIAVDGWLVTVTAASARAVPLTAARAAHLQALA